MPDDHELESLVARLPTAEPLHVVLPAPKKNTRVSVLSVTLDGPLVINVPTALLVSFVKMGTAAA